MTCPLCGGIFEENDVGVCRGCPINKGCNLVYCPYCGYEWPAETPLVKWVGKFFRKKDPHASDR